MYVCKLLLIMMPCVIIHCTLYMCKNVHENGLYMAYSDCTYTYMYINVNINWFMIIAQLSSNGAHFNELNCQTQASTMTSTLRCRNARASSMVATCDGKATVTHIRCSTVDARTQNCVPCRDLLVRGSANVTRVWFPHEFSQLQLPMFV